MANIKEGVKLLIVNPDGEVVETLELGGTNLTKPMARTMLVQEIIDSLTPSCYEEEDNNGER